MKTSKGLKRIIDYLIKNEIGFARETRFNNCKDKIGLPFDLQIIDNNKFALIEYDGIQHFKYTQYFHKSESDFLEQKRRDLIKTNYCYDNKIPLLRISYEEDKIEKCVENFISGFKKGKVEYSFHKSDNYKDHYRNSRCTIL